MSVIAAAVPSPNRTAELRESSRLPGSAPSAARTGPPMTGAISGGLVSIASIRPSRSASSGQRRVEDDARVGGVVVGDDDHRPLGVGRPDFADDVVGGAPRQQPPQRALAGREVGGDPAGADRAEQGPEQAPAAQRGEAAEGAEHGADPERPPVGAVGGLGLDPRLGAELADLAEHPLGGAPFAVGGRGTLDLLELLDQSAQPVLVR